MARRQGAWGHVEHVDDPHWTARRTLPLGGERTGRHVQGRVAVPPSLPLGIERTVSVRSGSSGSASGTIRVEWQCVRYVQGRVAVRLTLPLGGERAGRRAVHCHSTSSVPHWYVQRRVAVRPVRPGVSGGAPYTATRRRACRIGTFRGEWQCWPGRTPNPQPSCRLASGPAGQMRSGNRPPSRRGCAGARRPRPGTRPHGKAQSGQRASLMARPGPGRGTIRLPVVGSGGAGNSGLGFVLSAPMACHAWAQKRIRIAPTSRSPDDLRDSCTLSAELTRVQRVP